MQIYKHFIYLVPSRRNIALRFPEHPRRDVQEWADKYEYKILIVKDLKFVVLSQRKEAISRKYEIRKLKNNSFKVL